MPDVHFLLLDVGNSAVKWALVRSDVEQWPGRGRSQDQEGAGVGSLEIGVPDFIPTLAARLGEAIAAGGEAPLASVGCFVAAPACAHDIDVAARAAGAPAVQWLGAGNRFAHDGIVVENTYRDCTQLGADRWQALIGARARVARGAAAIIHAGTATVVDGLDGDGRFLGGVIAPGIDLMRSALARGTARLPLASGAYVAHADNTDDAIRTGILDAQLGLIERRVRRIRQHAGAPVRILLCGGHAPDLHELLLEHLPDESLERVPTLVLQGLWHQARAVTADRIAGGAT